MPSVGTRLRSNFLHIAPPQGHVTEGYTRDLGMSKLVNATLIFSTALSNVTNGTAIFAAFNVGDLILVSGTNANNGNFTVTNIDSQSETLTLSPPPNNEHVACTIRTQ